MAPFHHMHECVLPSQGAAGDAFQIAHGKHFWAYTKENPYINTLFNNGMESFVGWHEGFRSGEKLRLMDVGVGNGVAIAQVVEAHPHIHGINFDLFPG